MPNVRVREATHHEMKVECAKEKIHIIDLIDDLWRIYLDRKANKGVNK